MKASLYREEIICLVCDFLEKEIGQNDIAKTVREKHLPKQLHHEVFDQNLLISSGLAKVVKGYAQSNEKVKQYYFQRKEKLSKLLKEQQEADAESMPHQKSSNESQDSNIKKQFSAPEEAQNYFFSKINQHNAISSDEDSVELKQPKKAPKKAAKKHETSSSQSSSSTEQVIIKKVNKRCKPVAKVINVQSSESSSEEEVPKKKVMPVKKVCNPSSQDSSDNDELILNSSKKTVKQTGNAFSISGLHEIEQIKEEDNGSKGVLGKEIYQIGQKLKSMKGSSFQKEKGKLKNSVFQGKKIDISSIKFAEL